MIGRKTPKRESVRIVMESVITVSKSRIVEELEDLIGIINSFHASCFIGKSSKKNLYFFFILVPCLPRNRRISSSFSLKLSYLIIIKLVICLCSIPFDPCYLNLH